MLLRLFHFSFFLEWHPTLALTLDGFLTKPLVMTWLQMFFSVLLYLSKFALLTEFSLQLVRTTVPLVACLQTSSCFFSPVDGFPSIPGWRPVVFLVAS